MNNGTMVSNAPAQTDGVLMENGVPTVVSSGASSASGTRDLAGTNPAGVNTMSGDEKLHTISVLVENRPGVLARVSHVFARRGFNLESLAVSRTEDVTVSRMTIVVAGNDDAFTQIGKQLLKLIDVIKVIDHTRDDLVQRELALVKVRASEENRASLIQIAQIFDARLVDIAPDTMILEIVGKEAKIDAAEKMLADFEILELVRTGRIVLMRGEKQT